MTLIEWTRLEPGQVEAVVAMLVNREHPRSVRITPSRGDGGVDILDRRGGPSARDVVYQVKSYTGSLTKRQKDEIEGSLDTLNTDERWAGLDVEEWCLVTPWNPTPEAENWLQDLGESAGPRKVWYGLDHVEQLAAKYPDVIDSYLHGDSARIAAAQAEVLTLLGLERVSDRLTIDEVTERIQGALGVLDHDPHYRFEFGFGEGPPPEPRDRPGLVMHHMRGDTAANRWVTVDVIARCAASTQVQPITISGVVEADPDSPIADEWEGFMTYGAPVDLPLGSFSGDVTAPAGLGGSLDGASLRIGPTADVDLGENRELHLEVVGPDGDVLAAVDVDRVERSQGVGGGLRAVLRETHGIFELEDRYNLADPHTKRLIRLGQIAGVPVEAARAGVKVISELHAPNQIRLSVRHTPPSRGVLDGNTGFEWGEDQTAFVGATLRTLETLCEIQAASSTVVVTPDFGQVPREQFRNWRIAAALLRGESITGTYPEGHALTVELASEVTPGEEPLGISLPHTVLVDDKLIELGRYELWLENPTLVNRQEGADGVIAHTFTTPDRSFVWKRAKPEDD